MKSFEEWTADLIQSNAPKPISPTTVCDELMDYNAVWDEDSMWVYPCRGCQEDCDINCEPDEFDPDMHYCGGSPRCCP